MTTGHPGDTVRSKGRISGGASERSKPRLAHTPYSGLPGSADAMRAVRRRWATGVAVLTSGEEVDGAVQYRGATVSSFQVVSLEPPLVAVLLERLGATGAMILRSRCFAVSVLDRALEFQADRFAGLAPTAPADFAGIPHTIVATGAPVLDGALAWFDCRLERVVELGDHQLLLGRVERVGMAPDTDDPLLTYEGSYRRIEAVL
jgi:flavin reductase (DIM6/NTAB) family NADH-FMN oxidoreductase RutF